MPDPKIPKPKSLPCMEKYQGYSKRRRLTGIETYVTQTGIRTMRLHYSSDPNKNPDTPKGLRWLQSAVKGWPGGINGSKWQQEMEINFRIQGGRRIWPDWDVTYVPKVVYDPEDIDIQEHWPIYCGMDWGISNPTVFAPIAFESMGSCYLFDEVVMTDSSPKTIAEELKRKDWFDRCQGIIGDPSIWRRQPQKDEAEMYSVGKMFGDENIHIQPGRNDENADSSFVALLNGYFWSDLDNPMFRISSNCSNTIRCFRNIRRKQNTKLVSENKDEPEKIVSKRIDEFDALKYVLLSFGYELPEAEEFVAPPNTFEFYIRQMEREQQLHAHILG